MHIKITERFHPFSHTFGTFCVLPGSTLRLQIFPALIVVHDLLNAVPKLVAEIPVPAIGPIKEFTVQLDLEKGCVHVWGEDSNGYFRYRIFSDGPLVFEVDKGLSSWTPTLGSIKQVVPAKFVFTDRLSLGNHKSQDWDMVKRRDNLAEILPTWLRLGQFVEEPKYIACEGTASLLNGCQNISRTHIYDVLHKLFNLAFEGILSPRLTDELHQGFQLTPPPAALSPLILLTEGAKVIRSLFVHFDHNNIFILPRLPPQFHCGRLLQVRCGELGLLDFEWTKKMIRRMVFQAETTGPIQFHFPKDIARFRLNGKMHDTQQPVNIEKGQTYTFDRFTK